MVTEYLRGRMVRVWCFNPCSIHCLHTHTHPHTQAHTPVCSQAHVDIHIHRHTHWTHDLPVSVDLSGVGQSVTVLAQSWVERLGKETHRHRQTHYQRQKDRQTETETHRETETETETERQTN